MYLSTDPLLTVCRLLFDELKVAGAKPEEVYSFSLKLKSSSIIIVKNFI